ncbi:MAG: MerR family DNA-binding transcriptional regulator [Clostridia bacterium]|nr:MerR family DNA-binding transcriptional regulator [Clostridia bacterium]MCL6521678.1 MerR family DNA-binding transcriptional regulator [Bacillota bacterium]
MSPSPRRYTISELAEAFDTTPRALRYYEELGLLAPEREGPHRLYGERDRVRLKLILRGRRLGFSLEEIREMLDLYDLDPSEVTQLREVLRRGRRRIAEVEGQIAELQALLAELRDREAELRRLLAEKTGGREEGGSP